MKPNSGPEGTRPPALARRVTACALSGLLLVASAASIATAASKPNVRFDLGKVAGVVYEEDSFTVPEVSVDFDGHTFLSWNTEPDGTGRTVSTGDRVDEDLTLYAQWDDGDAAQTVTVTVDGEPFAGGRGQTLREILEAGGFEFPEGDGWALVDAAGSEADLDGAVTSDATYTLRAEGDAPAEPETVTVIVSGVRYEGAAGDTIGEILAAGGFRHPGDGWVLVDEGGREVDASEVATDGLRLALRRVSAPDPAQTVTVTVDGEPFAGGRGQTLREILEAGGFEFPEGDGWALVDAAGSEADLDGAVTSDATYTLRAEGDAPAEPETVTVIVSGVRYEGAAGDTIGEILAAGGFRHPGDGWVLVDEGGREVDASEVATDRLRLFLRVAPSAEETDGLDQGAPGEAGEGTTELPGADESPAREDDQPSPDGEVTLLSTTSGATSATSTGKVYPKGTSSSSSSTSGASGSAGTTRPETEGKQEADTVGKVWPNTGQGLGGALAVAVGAVGAALAPRIARSRGRRVLALLPVAAIAVAVSAAPAPAQAAEGRVGYFEDGRPITGLVTVGDTTWGWSGGELVRSKRAFVRDAWRNFDDDGEVIESGWHTLDGEEGYYEDGKRVTSRAVEREDGSWVYLGSDGNAVTGRVKAGDRVYFADDEGSLLEPGWHALSSEFGWDESQLVYIDEEAHAALLGFSAHGGNHFTRDEGFVVRGKWTNPSTGLTYLAGDDGILLSPGWVVTDEYDGGLQRYFIDPVTHAAPARGAFEVDGVTYVNGESGYVLRGFVLSGGVLVVADNEGRALSGNGWVITADYSDELQRYYVTTGSNGEVGARVGLFSVDGARYFGRSDTGYVVRGSYWDAESGRLISADNDGKIASITPARDLGGWDFADWGYVSEMLAYANAVGSDTDWFVTIDCDMPCRDVVFHRENGQWVPVAGFYAVQGFITLEGGSRTIPGTHKVTHKGQSIPSVGPGAVTAFVPYWSGGEDDSQAFHAGYSAGQSGYATHGCSALTTEHAQWIYDNIPVGSTVQVVGNATGIPSGADPDMPAQVTTFPVAG